MAEASKHGETSSVAAERAHTRKCSCHLAKTRHRAGPTHRASSMSSIRIVTGTHTTATSLFERKSSEDFAQEPRPQLRPDAMRLPTRDGRTTAAAEISRKTAQKR